MENNEEKKATLVLTYNSVDGYPSGMYAGREGPVVVVSHDNVRSWDGEAPRKLSELLHGLYDSVEPKNIKHVYMYIGLYAVDQALNAAVHFSHEGKDLTLIACQCDSTKKRYIADRIGAPIVWSECRGERTLGSIVDKLVKK